MRQVFPALALALVFVGCVLDRNGTGERKSSSATGGGGHVTTTTAQGPSSGPTSSDSSATTSAGGAGATTTTTVTTSAASTSVGASTSAASTSAASSSSGVSIKCDDPNTICCGPKIACQSSDLCCYDVGHPDKSTCASSCKGPSIACNSSADCGGENCCFDVQNFGAGVHCSSDCGQGVEICDFSPNSCGGNGCLAQNLFPQSGLGFCAP